MSIHRPINIEIHRDRNMVVLVVSGAGALKMPKDAAHSLARELMRVVSELETLEKRNGGSIFV
jgi:hypothetical protein